MEMGRLVMHFVVQVEIYGFRSIWDGFLLEYLDAVCAIARG